MPPENEEDLDLDLDLDAPDTEDQDQEDPVGEDDADGQEDNEGEEAAGDEGPDGKSRKANEGEEGDAGRNVKPLTRAEKRIVALSKQIKEREEKDAATQRELAELRARVTAPVQRTEQEERERRALMTPEERMQEDLDKGLRTNAAMLQRMEQMQRDTSDKLAFEASAQTDPRRKRLAETVEKVYQEQRAAGRWVPRETVYFHELGKLVAAQALKGKGKTGSEIQGRRRKQQANLGSGRGDVSSERGRGAKSFEDKYGDTPI